MIHQVGFDELPNAVQLQACFGTRWIEHEGKRYVYLCGSKDDKPSQWTVETITLYRKQTMHNAIPGLLACEEFMDSDDMAVQSFSGCEFLDSFGPIHKGCKADFVEFNLATLLMRAWLTTPTAAEIEAGLTGPDHIIPFKLVANPYPAG